MQLDTRVLGVSESGYYEWRGRAPSVRAVRHAWLTGQIQTVRLASRHLRLPPGALWVTDITEHPTPRRQGVLRGGAGSLYPPRGGLVDRQLADRLVTSALRGHSQPHRRPGRGDPLRPWFSGRRRLTAELATAPRRHKILTVRQDLAAPRLGHLPRSLCRHDEELASCC